MKLSWPTLFRRHEDQRSAVPLSEAQDSPAQTESTPPDLRPTILTAAEAKKLILSGRAYGPLHFRGTLDLSGHPLTRLPDGLSGAKVDANQHFTQPPPRYSEASLVKRMEELGIGRPSTYASILTVLQDRKYVRLDKRRFIPEDRGRLVTAFLVSFFEHYVDTGFTAALEEKLDEISAGNLNWRSVMHTFWTSSPRRWTRPRTSRSATSSPRWTRTSGRISSPSAPTAATPANAPPAATAASG